MQAAERRILMRSKAEAIETEVEQKKERKVRNG